MEKRENKLDKDDGEMQEQALKNHNKEMAFLWIGALILLVYGLKDIRQLNNIIVISDEFGYWGIAAHVAGKNWSSLLHTTPYYSYGYSLLLVPLFWLGLSSDVMYKTAIVLNVLLLIGSYFLCTYCAKKLLPALSGYSGAFLSFAVIMYTNTIAQAQIAWSETLLYFLYWAIFTLAIRLTESHRIVDAVLFGISNMYLYMVHQRCIGILLASVIYICVLFLSKKMNLKQLLCMCISFLLLLIFHKYIKQYSINEVFAGNELVATNDYSGQMGKLGFVLGSVNGFLSLLQSICGKLYYLGASTFLLTFTAAWYGMTQSFILCIDLLRKRFKPDEQDYRYLLSFFLTLSFGATFLINAIAMSVSYGRLDLLIYGRYMEFAIGPVLLYGIIRLWNTKKKYRLVLFEGIVMMFLSLIVNHGLIMADSNNFNVYCASVLNYFFNTRSAVSNLAFYISVMCTIMAFLLALFSNSAQDMKKWTVAACILLTGLWSWLSESAPAVRGQLYAQNCIGDIGTIISAGNFENTFFLDFPDTEIEHHIPAKFLQYELTGNPVCLIENTSMIYGDSYCILTYADDTALEKQSDRYLLIGKTEILKLYIPKP